MVNAATRRRQEQGLPRRKKPEDKERVQGSFDPKVPSKFSKVEGSVQPELTRAGPARTVPGTSDNATIDRSQGLPALALEEAKQSAIQQQANVAAAEAGGVGLDTLGTPEAPPQSAQDLGFTDDQLVAAFGRTDVTPEEIAASGITPQSIPSVSGVTPDDVFTLVGFAGGIGILKGLGKGGLTGIFKGSGDDVARAARTKANTMKSAKTSKDAIKQGNKADNALKKESAEDTASFVKNFIKKHPVGTAVVGGAFFGKRELESYLSNIDNKATRYGERITAQVKNVRLNPDNTANSVGNLRDFLAELNKQERRLRRANQLSGGILNVVTKEKFQNSLDEIAKQQDAIRFALTTEIPQLSAAQPSELQLARLQTEEDIARETLELGISEDELFLFYQALEKLARGLPLTKEEAAVVKKVDQKV